MEFFKYIAFSPPSPGQKKLVRSQNIFATQQKYFRNPCTNFVWDSQSGGFLITMVGVRVFPHRAVFLYFRQILDSEFVYYCSNNNSFQPKNVLR